MLHLHIHVYQKLLAKCGIYHGLPHIYSWVFIYLRHIFGEQIWANQFFCACIIAKIPKQLKEESKVKRNFQQRKDSNNNMKFVPRHFVLPFVCLFVFFSLLNVNTCARLHFTQERFLRAQYRLSFWRKYWDWLVILDEIKVIIKTYSDGFFMASWDWKRDGKQLTKRPPFLKIML